MIIVYVPGEHDGGIMRMEEGVKSSYMTTLYDTFAFPSPVIRERLTWWIVPGTEDPND